MATVAVKSSRAVGLAAAARGPVIGFFPVLSKSMTEFVVGADALQLDFRVTIQLRADAANGRELLAGTVVHCHNRLGRIYLTTTAPFHRVIARASSEQATRTMKIQACFGGRDWRRRPLDATAQSAATGERT